ncbi:Riboflavin transporter [Aphelenchoides besseyi]|nr:Riboflavin transporter [Aphelenchoides besseyi]
MEAKSSANPLIYLLVVWFASAPLLGNFSTFIEVSILTQQLPEGWNLTSVLIVVIQISSIGPLIFMILDRYFKIPIRHGLVIQVALIVSALMYIPLIFAWNSTIFLFGTQHSIVLISSIFVMGMIAIGSDIIFMPFMMSFDSVYLSAYFIGIGVSSLLPSLLSIAQGTSSYRCHLNVTTGVMEPQFASPRFSVNVFYTIIFVWVCGAGLSFYLINNHMDMLKHLSFRGSRKQNNVDGLLDRNNEEGRRVSLELQNVHPPTVEFEKKQTSRWGDLMILLSIAFVGADMNTILTSVQTFASIPYSQNTYFWSVIFATISALIGSFVAGFVKLRSTIFIIAVTLFCIVISSFVVLLGLQSPDPWLKTSTWGSLITVSAQSLAMATCTFVRLLATETYRDAAPNDENRLFWAGLSTQIGSFIGSLIVFPAVNIFGFFRSAPQC